MDSVIDFLENEFAGTRTLMVDGPTEPGEEPTKIELNYI